MDSEETVFSRKISGGEVKLWRSSKDSVTVAVKAGIFNKTWVVSIEDARWVRDSLFEALT